MPRLTCCPPEQTDYPSTMSAFIDNVSVDCRISVQFPIVWNGSRWYGKLGNYSVALACVGNDQVELSWDLGADCIPTGKGATITDCFQSELRFWEETAFVGCDNRCGEPGLSWDIRVEATPVPAGTPDVPSVPVCPENTPDECCPENAPSECCSSSDCGCDSPTGGDMPVRYSTGEVSVIATDLQSGGFGIPWGHTRSFANRLSVNATIGQGFNWQVKQWPYLVRSDVDQIVVLGVSNNAFWFNQVGDDYVSMFGVKHWLIHDNPNSVYRLSNPDGSYIEFDDVSGMFERQVDPAGNMVEVTQMDANTLNFTEVQRTYTSGATTTIEQYHYQYTTISGNTMLQRVTLRRKVGAAAWADVSRASYGYYGSGGAEWRRR